MRNVQPYILLDEQSEQLLRQKNITLKETPIF